jgi:hypothetical protein
MTLPMERVSAGSEVLTAPSAPSAATFSIVRTSGHRADIQPSDDEGVGSALADRFC